MTVTDLLASQSFELFCHHEYCEQAWRQFQGYAYILGEPQFVAQDVTGPLVTGRFLAQAEFEDGPHGATTGTFRLTLSDGLAGIDADAVLRNADLDVTIESAPADHQNSVG